MIFEERICYLENKTEQKTVEPLATECFVQTGCGIQHCCRSISVQLHICLQTSAGALNYVSLGQS